MKIVGLEAPLSQTERNAMLIRTRQVRDFHSHSYYSDGLFSPTELVEFASKEGVAQLALTDHDTIGGLDEAIKAGRRFGVDIIPGLEISSKTSRGKDAHILGYGFNMENARKDDGFMNMLNAVKESDHTWARKMCKKSKEEPLIITTPDGRTHSISVEESEMEQFQGTISSTFHMSLILRKKLASISPELDMQARHIHYTFFRRHDSGKETESYDPATAEKNKPLLERFKIVIPPRGIWRVERPKDILADANEAIKAISRIGGIPVLAHPGEFGLKEDDIAEMVSSGLRGMEVYSYKHKPEEVKYYEEVARKHGLFMTAGTDFHDPYHRARINLGTARSGDVISEGVSMGDFKSMGALTYENPLPKIG